MEKISYTERNRPLFISVLSILYIGLGLVIVFGGVALLLLYSIVIDKLPVIIVNLGMVGIPLIFITGILHIVGGVWLWKLKKYGYFIIMILLFIEICIWGFLGNYILILVNIGIVYYLYKNRQLFE